MTATVQGIFIDQGTDFYQQFAYPDAQDGDSASAQMARWGGGPVLGIFDAQVDAQAKTINVSMNNATTANFHRSGVYEVVAIRDGVRSSLYRGPATLRIGTIYASGEKLDASAEAFVFTQSSPNSTWTIHHGLNRFPEVTVVDSLGEIMWTDVSYPDANTVVVTFSVATSGSAYLE